MTLAVLSVALGLAMLYPPFLHLDFHATQNVQEFATHSWDSAMLAVSFMGKETVLFLFATVCSMALLVKHRARTAAYLMASLLSLPVTSYLKDVWDRARPDGMDVRVLMASETHSFPSGHVLGATAVYGFFAYLVWKSLRNSWIRTAILVTTLVLLVAIGLSRVYLGVHWLADVLGGLVFGALFAVILIAAYRANLKDAPR